MGGKRQPRERLVFVNATLPSRFHFEVLDNVSDVSLSAINSASSKASSSSRPAGQRTAGAKSSSLPGCSQLEVLQRRERPSPNTVSCRVPKDRSLAISGGRSRKAFKLFSFRERILRQSPGCFLCSITTKSFCSSKSSRQTMKLQF